MCESWNRDAAVGGDEERDGTGGLGAEAATGWSLVIFMPCAHECASHRAPCRAPWAWQARMIQAVRASRSESCVSGASSGSHEQRRSRPWSSGRRCRRAQGVEGGRDQLGSSEQSIDARRSPAPEGPVHREHQHRRERRRRAARSDPSDGAEDLVPVQDVQPRGRRRPRPGRDEACDELVAGPPQVRRSRRSPR